VNGACLNLKLEDELQIEIRTFYISTRDSKQMKDEFINFTGNIS
jgi:CRP-like cAMP-binding protein